MSKPRMYGMPGSFTPNSKMDMRHKKKLYQRQREISERAEKGGLRMTDKENMNVHADRADAVGAKR